MASLDKYSELLISETLIPDIFIARYMPMLGKDALAIYLWTKMAYKGGAFTLKDVIDYGAIPAEDVKTALAELVTAGILVRKNNDKFEPVDLKKIEVDEYLNRNTDSEGVPVMRSDEKSRNLLATSIQKTYYQGRMAYVFYRLIDTCLYEYHFEENVVYSLFEEGRELRIHYIPAKMSDLAKKWYEKGYTTNASLSGYYESRQRRTGVTALVGKRLRHHLRDRELEHINMWVTDFGVDEALVEYAIDCLEYRNTISTQDISNKLKEWIDAGAMTIDKAMLYENERHKENAAKASKGRGRTNVRKSGKQAGITLEEPKAADSEPKEEEKPEPAHDSILDMFSGDDDEDN